MSTRYLGTCHETGKRMLASRAEAKKAIRQYGERGANAYRCPSCDHWHWGHTGGRSRAEIRGDLTAPPAAAWATASERAQEMTHLEALAAAYQLEPTARRWNAFVKALNIPADRAPMRGPDPTATTAVARVDRERRSS